MTSLGRKGRVAALALFVSVMVTTSACDLRLETSAPPLPSPDAIATARNTLADAEGAVFAASLREIEPTVAGANLVAAAHLDALGGVYVAYPDVTAAPDDDPTATPAPEPSLDEAIAAARAVAFDVASTTEDPELAFLATSIDLEWALRGEWAAHVSAVADAPSAVVALRGYPLPDGSTAESAGFVPAGATGVPEQALSALALAHDQARFAYETLAAQEFGPRRDEALARARLHDERSDALAADLTEDPRTPLYQVHDADLLNADSRRSLERSIELDLAMRYAVLLDGVADADRLWLLNATFDNFARAMTTDGFSAQDIPTLPGLRPTP